MIPALRGKGAARILLSAGGADQHCRPCAGKLKKLIPRRPVIHQDAGPADNPEGKMNFSRRDVPVTRSREGRVTENGRSWQVHGTINRRKGIWRWLHAVLAREQVDESRLGRILLRDVPGNPQGIALGSFLRVHRGFNLARILPGRVSESGDRDQAELPEIA